MLYLYKIAVFVCVCVCVLPVSVFQLELWKFWAINLMNTPILTSHQKLKRNDYRRSNVWRPLQNNESMEDTRRQTISQMHEAKESAEEGESVITTLMQCKVCLQGKLDTVKQ